jgi:hypothetical protein
MPRLYCLKCKSEWKSTNPLSTCEFCGTKGHLLEENAPFEKSFGENTKDAIKITKNYLNQR